MTDSPGRRLRQAWAEQPVPVPGVFNPLVARLAERIGFRAVYLSGAALSAALGLPDIGLATLGEFVEEARRIVQATSLPLVCDADTGFGEALNVERAVRLFREVVDRLPAESLGGTAGTRPLPVGLIALCQYRESAAWRLSLHSFRRWPSKAGKQSSKPGQGSARAFPTPPTPRRARRSRPRATRPSPAPMRCCKSARWAPIL